MMDIVDDLRFTADDEDIELNASVADLLKKAAAEIDRLRLTDGSADRPKPSAYLAMASGYDFGAFMTEREAEDWLSHKDTNWKRTAPLYVWFEWEEMREARQRMAVKESHMYRAEISDLREQTEKLRLTEKERNAIESAAKLRLALGPDCQAVLRGLLERLK